jgi:predicted glycosyltransferase
MRVIFDLGHPAHFHLFKHSIANLKESGHDVEIIARQKDCLSALLDKTEWPYRVVRRKRSGFIASGWQNVKAFMVALFLGMRKRTDLMVGTSIVVGPAARLTGATSIVFSEDNAKETPIFSKLAYPIAHYIVTPESLKFEKHGKKHLTYPGYHELAYLHPNRYTPDKSVLKKLGVKEGERYFLIRLVALAAHHDVGEKGIGTEQAKTLIKHLSKYGRVFISTEKVVDEGLKPYLLPTRVEEIFDVMAFADMVIGDSQTMITEASVLGTPSLRCNTFVGRLSCMEELEHRYGLTAGFLPRDFDKLLAKVNEWLAEPELKQKWAQKRQAMLAECVDLTNWIIDLFNELSANNKRGKKRVQ